MDMHDVSLGQKYLMIHINAEEFVPRLDKGNLDNLDVNIHDFLIIKRNGTPENMTMRLLLVMT